MQLSTRKMLDRALSGTGFFSILLMAAALLVLIVPIAQRGIGAIFFDATVEHRRMMLEQFHNGDPIMVKMEIAEAEIAREPVVAMLTNYAAQIESLPFSQKKKAKSEFKEVRNALAVLLGPIPGDEKPMMIHSQYGQTRWDRAEVKLEKVLFAEEYDYSDKSGMGKKVLVPRGEHFKGTTLEPMFAYVKDHARDMLHPQSTVYWGFFTDVSIDSHFFGGIWPEILGTLYLTLGAMLFAIPMGVIAAIYLCEYARPSPAIRILRICISTLAGVPSIVFGLFGLAFFINTAHVSASKSVLAGSMTLALLILPTIIRASEEAILAVPRTYKEAALSLGGGLWHTIVKVILPAALPGILTGIVISMGRAAGETAPIIFTAAVSVGRPISPIEALTQPTPALPWNIYNISTEHAAVDEIRHVQFGMVLTLVTLVLLLNLTAIILRARIAKKLKG